MLIMSGLGISELKCTGMGDLTQMTIISTTVGKNPLEKMSPSAGDLRELPRVPLRGEGLLRCNSFARIQETVVDQTGSRSPNRPLHFF